MSSLSFLILATRAATNGRSAPMTTSVVLFYCRWMSLTCPYRMEILLLRLGWSVNSETLLAVDLGAGHWFRLCKVSARDVRWIRELEAYLPS